MSAGQGDRPRSGSDRERDRRLREVDRGATRRRGRRTRAAKRRRARWSLAGLALALGLAVALALVLGGSGRRHGAGTPAIASRRRAGGTRRSGHGAVRADVGTPSPSGQASHDGESGEILRLIALGKPIYCAPARGDEVALTFDDGPGPYTRLMLDKLRKHRVRATFFVVGRNIPLVAGATARERAIGAVGDHTFTHPLLTALAPGGAEAEIVRTQRALARSSGGRVFLFRPPYGAHDAAVDEAVRRHGLLEILWTVDSRDSLGASYSQIERNVIAGLRPGAIILMHENHGQTVRAMLAIFAALARRHLRAVSVPQLLTDDPPSAAFVRSGASACATHLASLAGG